MRPATLASRTSRELAAAAEKGRHSSILRWAGSKKRSLRDIVPFLPSTSSRYLEVFAGSACLFFYIAPQAAVISDNNIELIHFYKTLARHPLLIYQRFVSIPRNADTYYRVRARFPQQEDPTARAADFLYLNRNCFNGIYRTNSKGEFNVPFAEKRVARYPSESDTVAAAGLLRRAKIERGDFETVCERNVRKGDFIYLDPPYYVPTKRVFREYSSRAFCSLDFGRLDRTLRRIDRAGARFLLSYPDCEVAAELARPWKSKRISVRRTIASDVQSRGTVREILVYNYDLKDA